MEDTLAVYTTPHDPDQPLVCLDETSKQLIGQTRMPVPMKRGQPARTGDAYERNATATLFMLFAPLEGWRHVTPSERHAAADDAAILGALSDRHFPVARKIVLVQDSLSTQTAASLHASFAPAEARRRAERFEWHDAPKHGSWLNMAEAELGVLSSQCLDRRIADKASLIREVDAGQAYRNKHHAEATWQLTNDNARVKLRHLYPSL